MQYLKMTAISSTFTMCIGISSYDMWESRYIHVYLGIVDLTHTRSGLESEIPFVFGSIGVLGTHLHTSYATPVPWVWMIPTKNDRLSR